MTQRYPIAEGVTVAVAPTDTVLFAPVPLSMKTHLYLAVRNDDAAQLVTARIQTGPTSSGPWLDLPNSILSDIAALALGEDTFETLGRPWARGVATSSGSGGNVTVWAASVIDRGRSW